MFIMFICIQSPKQKMKINSHNLQGLRLQHLVNVELKLQKETEIRHELGTEIIFVTAVAL